MKFEKIKKNNFLIIILLVLNIIFWNYYIIYNTNIYKIFFYDFNNGSQASKNTGYLFVNFFSDENDKFTILQTPTNKIAIIDTGGDKDAKKIINYMKSKKFIFIDTIFLTNGDDNALNGLRKILNTFSVGEVVDGILYGNEQVRYIVSKHPEVSYTKASTNKNIYIDPYLDFKLYYASDDRGRNFGSLYIYMQYKNKSILFTADNGEKEQYGLIKTWEIMKEDYQKIDILEYPYIDSQDTVFQGLVNKIKPRYVIVSNKSLVNNDLIDMNIWNNFSAKQSVKYIKNRLTLKTDGNKVYV